MPTEALTPELRRAIGWAFAVLLALGLAVAIMDTAADTIAFRNAAAAPIVDGTRSMATVHPPVLWPAPEFALVDQSGALLTKAALRDRVWIANFIFTRCTSVCPTLTAKMRALQRKLPNADLRFVSFSVDPEHDTPSALHDYAQAWGKAEARWSLLRTDAASLRAVTDGMRVVAEPSRDAEGPILHTSSFFLVDRAGRVRGQYDGNDERALQDLLADARILSPEPSFSKKRGEPNESGKAYFEALGCAGCHDNPKLAPSLRGIWGREIPLAEGKSARVDETYLRTSLESPSAQLVTGYLDLMPSYANDLSERQRAALLEYLKSIATTEGEPGPGPANPQAARPRPAESAAVIARDPVCGMQVRVTPETPRAGREDSSHYFCSARCRDRFLSAADGLEHARGE